MQGGGNLRVDFGLIKLKQLNVKRSGFLGVTLSLLMRTVPIKSVLHARNESKQLQLALVKLLLR